jgi:hypothetical protein
LVSGQGLSGVSATGSVGTVSFAKSVGLTGVYATGAVGNVYPAYWIPIPTDQTPSWALISTTQTPSWITIPTP